MIDLDLYKQNSAVEEFVEILKRKLIKDHLTIPVYISTANPYNHWSQKLYNLHDKKEEQNG